MHDRDHGTLTKRFQPQVQKGAYQFATKGQFDSMKRKQRNRVANAASPRKPYLAEIKNVHVVSGIAPASQPSKPSRTREWHWWEED